MKNEILTRVVVDRIPIVDDLEIHVCTVEVDGVRGVDIRNYIPSTQSYGRGIIFPHDHVKAIRAALNKA